MQAVPSIPWESFNKCVSGISNVVESFPLLLEAKKLHAASLVQTVSLPRLWLLMGTSIQHSLVLFMCCPWLYLIIFKTKDLSAEESLFPLDVNVPG